MALLLAALSVLTPAQAAVPANDTYQTAAPITATPFSATVDTTEATPDVGMGRYRFHGIWYRLQLPNDGRVFMTLKGSEFSPQLLRMYRVDETTDAPGDVVKGDRTYRSNDYARFAAKVEGGESYYVLIGTDRDGTGGLAKLTVRRPARVAVGLAKYAKLGRIDGSAILAGTFRATRTARVTISTQLRQLVKDRVVRGWGYRSFTIPAGSTPWTMKVAAERSFKLGPARISDDRIRIYDDGALVVEKHFVRRVITLK